MKKHLRFRSALFIACGLALTIVGTSLAGEPLQPLPAAKDLPGALQFHGHYRHRSRGIDIEQPGELWVNKTPDGRIVALARLPWTGTSEMVSGDTENRPQAFRVCKAPLGDAPGYGINLEFTEGKARLTRRGVREDCDQKELAVAAGACFDPNSRPDSYCTANVLLRRLAPKAPGEANEFRVCDWDNTGEALVDYTVKVRLLGKEKVDVPAGSFEANHIVLTQTSSANTWFKKRTGHVTDFWILDNGVIVRILRHREPYELVLLDYDAPRN
ncbi:MAG TPA: hypothetical protein PK640_14015 [Verrucomicrobiota bacterium]|nr:hypothetical protein [Verrucomicrobiota bacterium]